MRAGDDVCGQCDALFTAAHTLLDNNVHDEAAVLGTLAFAWSRDVWGIDSENYCGLEHLSTVDGVPLLRLPRITTGLIYCEGSHIPKAANISVYSRDVKPQELAEVYERLLMDHGIHFDESSGGSVVWDIEDANLTITVRAMKEPAAWRTPYLKTYPAGRIYSFPPPTLVKGFYGTLLGSTHKKTFSGYAYALAEGGRHTSQKAVMGSVAWLLGERSNNAIPPGRRRPRIAKTLNKHLLTPRSERELLEDSWTPDDTVWRDASVLGPRLMRNLYLLQEGYKQQFP
ncbi:MAG: hypothetical protein M3491_05150 [Actinomycetota bacterium]|nr:hypothetical protein [Rubrobacteraceae bacterium]MDQ3436714.1 hypothetical protein [Actinomycetota bacterium]